MNIFGRVPKLIADGIALPALLLFLLFVWEHWGKDKLRYHIPGW